MIGREFELPATAKDDGPETELKYSVEGDVPAGLKVDEASGIIKWTPAKSFAPGSYTVSLKVTDSGSPAKSDSKQIALTVEDDHAILTEFTGSLTIDGVHTALFRNFATNARPTLHVGDRVNVSDIDAELKEISNRYLLLADAAGIWKLPLGANLRERELVEEAEKSHDTASSADSTPEAATTSGEPETAEGTESVEPTSPEKTIDPPAEAGQETVATEADNEQ